MADLTPQILDRRWGDDFHERLDILQHPIRLPGGNPAVLFRHGGAMQSGDKRFPWTNGNTGNPLATYLNGLGAGFTPFDFVSLGTPQAAFSPISAPHLPTTFDEPRTIPSYYPDNYKALPRAIAWLREHRAEFGLSGQFIGYGGSAGAHLYLATQCWPPLLRLRSETQRFYKNEALREDSRVLGIINESGQIDYRNILGVDQILWTWGDAHFGAWTQTEWDNVPNEMKASISIMAFLERGDIRWVPPILSVYEIRGGHVHPYSNPHDDAQLDTLHDKLDELGLPNERHRIQVDDWTDATAGPILSQQVYAWMVSLLAA